MAFCKIVGSGPPAGVCVCGHHVGGVSNFEGKNRNIRMLGGGGVLRIFKDLIEPCWQTGAVSHDEGSSIAIQFLLQVSELRSPQKTRGSGPCFGGSSG